MPRRRAGVRRGDGGSVTRAPHPSQSGQNANRPRVSRILWPAGGAQAGMSTLRLGRPQTRYAKSGEVSIAYQVVGDGPIDLVMVPGFVSHVEVAWEEPSY